MLTHFPKISLIILLFSLSYFCACQNEGSNKKANSKTKKLDKEAQYRATNFKHFLNYFEQRLSLPINFTAQMNNSFLRKEAIPDDLVQTFICETSMPKLNCQQYKRDTSYLKSFYPVGIVALNSPNTVVCLFQYQGVGYAETYVASYSKDGIAKGKALFAGSKPKEGATDGHFEQTDYFASKKSVYVFEEGRPTDKSRLEINSYEINANGVLQKITKDQINQRASQIIAKLPKVAAKRAEVEAKGHTLQYLPKPDFPNAKNVEHYIRVGIDNGKRTKMWQHFFVNPLNLEVRVYDVEKGKLMSLKEWEQLPNQ